MVAFDNQKIGPKEQFAANHFQGIILDMIISFCFPIASKLLVAFIKTFHLYCVIQYKLDKR